MEALYHIQNATKFVAFYLHLQDNVNSFSETRPRLSFETLMYA